MPGVSGVTVAHYAHVLAAGVSAPGIPAPSDGRAEGKFQQSSGEWRREIYMHVWRPSLLAKQSSFLLLLRHWIGSLRYARN
jgi:hypothetical protein